MIQPSLRAALVIGAIVVASGIAGAAIDRAFLTRTAAVAQAGRDNGGGRRGGGGGDGGRRGSFPELEARRRAEMLERMTKSLSLTPAQRAGFDSVFQRTDSSLRTIRREMQPRISQVFESSRVEMNARLDSAQRVKFAAMRGPGGGGGRGRGDSHPGRDSGSKPQ